MPGRAAERRRQIEHRSELDEVKKKGRDVERMALSRAVRWHLEHRILVYGNRVVFN